MKLFVHPPLLLLAFALLLVTLPTPFADAKIILTPTEQSCLELTGKLFDGNEEMKAARHTYATSMETEMTSSLTMTARYPEDKWRSYQYLCEANGGVLHTVKIDFFDCKLGSMNQDIELTLKLFANCLADVDECSTFDQENLLEEAWEELGLHCVLEEGGPNGGSNPPHDPSSSVSPMDDDLAHQEEKAATQGADDVDRAEKAAQYVSKEEQQKKQQNKGRRGGKLFTIVLTMGIVGGVAYVLYDRRFALLGRRRRPLPWGGVTTSRFQTPLTGGGGGSGFVSDYHFLSGEDEFQFGNLAGSTAEHELQLSSTLTA